MRLARPALALLAVVALTRPLAACLNDRDTLADEAKGRTLDVVRIITGRFERNPPAYYQGRIDRTYDRIKAAPADLAAYDDIAVAADRIGRSDEAIDWIEQKRRQIDLLAASGAGSKLDLDEQRYRYLANVGTFRVHRWLKAGADRAKLDEVRAARDSIARAIALKPDAHFGREAVQLRVLDWIIAPPSSAPGGLSTFLAPTDRDESTVVGITGLIALGNAWESVDVFNALALALERSGNLGAVAMLARLRADELIDAGRRSLDPAAPTDPAALKRAVRAGANGGVDGSPNHRASIALAFATLRREADAWQAAHTAYMLPRLESGRHPDTDRNFWAEYRDVPAPAIPDEFVPAPSPSRRSSSTGVKFGIAGVVLSGALLLEVGRRVRRRGLVPPHRDDLPSIAVRGL